MYDLREVSWWVAIARLVLAVFIMVAGVVALDVAIYLTATGSTFDERVATAFTDAYDYGYSETFEVAFEEARDEAFDRGYIKGFEISLGDETDEAVSRLVETHNPTYQELMEFLAADAVNDNVYVSGTYVCFDYTAELNNNADAEGIRAAYVRIRGEAWAHAIVAFDTVDRGLVFIEPQSDMKVDLEIGKPYPWRQLGAISTLGNGENIRKVQLIW
jgi:hypothetical protein